MNNLFRLLLCIVLFPLSGVAQDKRTNDSLLGVLKAAEDTQRVHILRELSYNNRVNNPDLAMRYANEAVALADALDYDNGRFDAYMQKGLVFYNLSQHDSSLKYFETARLIAEQHGDPKQLAAIYSNMGNAYGDIGQNKKCLSCYLKSSMYTEQTGQKFKAAYLQVNIGTIYSVMDQHDSALVFYESALKKMLELDPNDEKLYIVYGNLGATYMELGDTARAEDAFLESQRIAVLYNNFRALASSYDHLAIIEFSKGNVDTALMYYRYALQYANRIKAGQSISETSMHLGSTFLQMGQYDSALFYLSTGVQVAEQIKDYYTLDDYYEALSRVYEETGRADSALFYYKKLYAVQDTLYAMNKSNIVGEMRTELENEKREKEIELLKEQDEKKNLILYSSFAVGVLVLLLLILAVNRYLVKKRSAMVLQKQKEEIEVQKEIIEEKNKDITDSIRYAKRIQNAILPSDDYRRSLFPESWCCFIPKDIVSGDFYWFEQEGDYKLFGVVDCTGHGVPGALLSVVGHSVLAKALTDLKVVMPDKILNFLDQEIYRTLHHRDAVDDNGIQDGMDVALCCYHEKSSTLYYAGAFNPMYLIRNGQLQEVKADKILIGSGMSRNKPFSVHEIKVQKGDEVILFSDGFADQFGGPFGKKLKYKPFKQMLLSYAGKPVHHQLAGVARSFDDWRQHHDQVDDVCVVGVRL
jgi:serine phosphatase RsbU (regulator of sigma subunit)